jgi:hypothetical protein
MKNVMKTVKVNVVFEIEVPEEAQVMEIFDHVQKCINGSNFTLWAENVRWMDTTLKSIDTVETTELNYSI